MAKVNISLPDELLEQIDSLAAQTDRSRSGLVQEATAAYVTRVLEERRTIERAERIDRAIKSAREIGAKFGTFDSTASVREDRDRDGRRAGEQ